MTVSSAKSLIDDFIASGRSFIKMRNNIGPKTVPWGTPDLTGDQLEHVPLTTTRCRRSVKKSLSQSCRLLRIPYIVVVVVIVIIVELLLLCLLLLFLLLLCLLLLLLLI